MSKPPVSLVERNVALLEGGACGELPSARRNPPGCAAMAGMLAYFGCPSPCTSPLAGSRAICHADHSATVSVRRHEAAGHQASASASGAALRRPPSTACSGGGCRLSASGARLDREADRGAGGGRGPVRHDLLVA